jgi:uncharacterized protein (DUF433 family)
MNDFYNKVDVRNIPTYSIKDAAQYLRIPISTVRSWTVGLNYHTKEGSSFFAPLIEIPKQKPYLLSFTNIVELHVLRAIRSIHKIKLNKAREAIDFIIEELKVSHPLATKQFSTDGVNLFVEHYGKLIQANQDERNQLKMVFDAHLKRIEPDDSGLAIKLYPFTRSHEEDSPRIVSIDPRNAFGRLTIDGTGITTSILKERYLAGDSIEELAVDYNFDSLYIQEAIRCELPMAA